MTLINPTQNIYSVFHTALRCSVSCAIWTAIWIPIYIYRCLLVQYVRCFKPSFGKVLDQFDSALEENYSEVKPRTILVFSLVIEGSIELQELQSLFIRNVLEAKVSNKRDSSSERWRYPELKQYQTDLGGYRFWRNDTSFNIANHITERPYKDDSKFLVQVHQELVNKSFPKYNSPWEIQLIKNYENNTNKSVLFCRFHHSMGDTLSVLKMLVEHLGQKQLTLPNVEYLNTTLLDQILYYVLLPFYVVYVQVLGIFTTLDAQDCPWKYNGSEKEDTSSLNVAVSGNISLNEVKAIAKKNNITTSAVIMAAITGGVRKFDHRLREKQVACKWVLPKANHPDILANHNYSASISIPTDISSLGERLLKCNDIILGLKSSNLHKYAKSLSFQAGTWINPWRKNFVKNTTHPLSITNIAGGTEEFMIGSSNRCTDITMSTGPLRGTRGLMFCAFSYMDKMEIIVVARDVILNASQTQTLTNHIETEFNNILRGSTL